MKSDVTYKTDQFAIGVISFWILTDQFPYGDCCEIGEQLLMNISQNQMGDIRQYNNSVNGRLIQFIEKLLQVRPNKRFRKVETIFHNLNEIRKSLT